MLDIVALRQMVYKPLGIEYGDAELPTTDVDLYLNRAYWELQNKFPIKEVEQYEEFNTVAGTRNYRRPARTESIYHLSIMDPDSEQHKPLIQITVDEYETLYNEKEENQSIPVKYCLENCIIRMWPTPDAAYKIIMRRRIELTDLNGTTSTAPQILPKNWHEIIGYGGLWRAFIDKGDLVRAQFIQAKQNDLIENLVVTESKEYGINRQFARFQLPPREY